MSTYKVVAPYVTLRVRDDVLGQEQGYGFHAGAVLPESVNQEDLERHVRKGMVAKAADPAPKPAPKPAAKNG